MGSVLVVDDDPAVRNLLAATLRRDGFDVQCACDGEEALLLARHSTFDAVLSDVDMPHLDGLSLARILVSTRDDQAIVLMSGRNTQELRDRAAEAGACGFLPKPFARTELLATVTTAATRTRSAAS